MPTSFIMISDTAEILGVSKQTLRNWDKLGKLVAYRHPINNYRLYKSEDVYRIIDLMGEPLEERELKKDRVRKLEVRHE